MHAVIWHLLFSSYLCYVHHHPQGFAKYSTLQRAVPLGMELPNKPIKSFTCNL